MKKYIPTKEDFERADRLGEIRSNKEKKIYSLLLREYSEKLTIHRLFLTINNVQLFFKTEAQKSAFLKTNMREEFESDFLRMLDALDAREEEFEPTFIYDSHEMVLKKYKGDYFKRLR